MRRIEAKDKVYGPGWEGYVDDILQLEGEDAVLVRGLVFEIGEAGPKNKPTNRAKYFAHKVREWAKSTFTLDELELNLRDAIDFKEPEPPLKVIEPDPPPEYEPDRPGPKFMESVFHEPPPYDQSWYQLRGRALLILYEIGWTYVDLGKLFRISGWAASVALRKYEIHAKRAEMHAFLGETVPTRIMTICDNAGIYSLEELRSRSEGELRRIPNCGRKSIQWFRDRKLWP